MKGISVRLKKGSPPGPDVGCKDVRVWDYFGADPTRLKRLARLRGALCMKHSLIRRGRGAERHKRQRYSTGPVDHEA